MLHRQDACVMLPPLGGGRVGGGRDGGGRLARRKAAWYVARSRTNYGQTAGAENMSDGAGNERECLCLVTEGRREESERRNLRGALQRA